MLILTVVLCFGCKQEQRQKQKQIDTWNERIAEFVAETPKHISNIEQGNRESGITIEERIQPPANFTRSKEKENSFQEYLRTLKLKPSGSEVKYYNGSTKPNHNVYHAVVDLSIGDKDLHQCADAVMRLRAEYLWSQELYNLIHFNFTNGFKVDYAEWMKGRRMVVNGNNTNWNDRVSSSNTYDDFWSYMELIFTYAGTASLEKELQKVDINDAEIGDVLIQGGYPGHAVIIVDKAINQESGMSIYLLAQSYMPAQEIQILQNPNDQNMSPWFELSQGAIRTPEWRFTSDHLKRFGD